MCETFLRIRIFLIFNISIGEKNYFLSNLTYKLHCKLQVRHTHVIKLSPTKMKFVFFGGQRDK